MKVLRIVSRILILSTLSISGFTFWDWDAINLDQELTALHPAPHFLWGTSTAEYQISGADNLPNSQWAHWEKAHSNPRKRFYLEPSGTACDSLHHRAADIACMKELGINAFRFSVDWSLIEPEQGKINYQALGEYDAFCTALVEQGITPVVALHHQVHPQWFAELGAFEREENIQYFIDFCTLVFTCLHKKVGMWTILAEPTTHVLQGYLRGVCPPGYVGQFTLAGTVLKNLLLTQVYTYNALKKLPGGDHAQIGLAHLVLHFEPYYSWNPISRTAAYYVDYVMNDPVINFFKTGIFEFTLPGVHVYHECPEAIHSFDFFGIDYYSRVLLQTTGNTYSDQAIKTDMPFELYAEGLYDAIQEVSVFGKPIYILENGIADAQDDRRELWIKRHIYALKRALDDGYDVRGFFYWSLLDNYEWDMGYEKKFGLFHVDMETKKRTLRHGARAYQEIVQNWRNTIMPLLN